MRWPPPSLPLTHGECLAFCPPLRDSQPRHSHSTRMRSCRLQPLSVLSAPRAMQDRGLAHASAAGPGAPAGTLQTCTAHHPAALQEAESWGAGTGEGARARGDAAARWCHLDRGISVRPPPQLRQRSPCKPLWSPAPSPSPRPRGAGAVRTLRDDQGSGLPAVPAVAVRPPVPFVQRSQRLHKSLVHILNVGIKGRATGGHRRPDVHRRAHNCRDREAPQHGQAQHAVHEADAHLEPAAQIPHAPARTALRFCRPPHTVPVCTRHV